MTYSKQVYRRLVGGISLAGCRFGSRSIAIRDVPEVCGQVGILRYIAQVGGKAERRVRYGHVLSCKAQRDYHFLVRWQGLFQCRSECKLVKQLVIGCPTEGFCILVHVFHVSRRDICGPDSLLLTLVAINEIVRYLE